MVGHTGDIEATIVACKAADEAVKVICFVNLCITWIRPAPSYALIVFVADDH